MPRSSSAPRLRKNAPFNQRRHVRPFLETLEERSAPTDLTSIVMDLTLPGYLLVGAQAAANIAMPLSFDASKVQVAQTPPESSKTPTSADSSLPEIPRQ